MSESPETPAENEAAMLADMRRYVEAGQAITKRERRIARRLRTRNLRLRRQRSGYAIADRYTELVEADGLTLEAAETWAAANVPAGGGGARMSTRPHSRFQKGGAAR